MASSAREIARPPAPAVAALVGAQYYWVLHHHPVALLGYIGLLEGYPPGRPRYGSNELRARTGVIRVPSKFPRSSPTPSSTRATATSLSRSSTSCR